MWNVVLKRCIRMLIVDYEIRMVIITNDLSFVGVEDPN